LNNWFWVTGLGFLVLGQGLIFLKAKSVTSWVALGCGSMGGVIICSLRSEKSRSLLALAAGILIVIVSLTNPVTMIFPAYSPSKKDVSPGMLKSLRGRLYISQITKDAILSSKQKWLGIGVGHFPQVFLEKQGDHLSSLSVREASSRFENPQVAHHDYLQILLELGVIGLVLFVLLFLGMLVRFSHNRDCVGSIVTLTFMIAMWTDSPFRYPSCTIILFLHLALLPRTISPRWPRVFSWHWRNRQSHTFVLIPMLLLLLWGLHQYAPSVLATRMGTLAEQQLFAYAKENFLRKALAMDPENGEIQFMMGLALLENGHPADALHYLKRSQSQFANIGTFVAIGNAELEQNHIPQAILAYQNALKQNPGLFKAHINLASAYLKANNLPGANDSLSRAKKLYPFHPILKNIEEEIRRQEERK
jgi:tetratricopeptide (TPR) repeat protein